MIPIIGFRRRGRKPCQKTLLLAVEWILHAPDNNFGMQKRVAYENGICPKKLNTAVAKLRKAARN